MAAITTGFFSLPLELRQQIYRELFHPANLRNWSKTVLNAGDDKHRWHMERWYEYKSVLPFLQTNRQIYTEGSEVFYKLNTFVKISTKSDDWRRHSGLYRVPIVCGLSGTQFEPWSSLIVIRTEGEFTLAKSDGSEVMVDKLDPNLDEHFVILIDSLDILMRWYSYTNVDRNSRAAFGIDEDGEVAVEVTLRTPPTYARILRRDSLPNTSQEEGENLPPPDALQLALLKPLGRLKDLRHFHAIGCTNISILAEVEKEMEDKLPCGTLALRNSQVRHDHGVELLRLGQPSKALAEFELAFAEIFVLLGDKHRYVFLERVFNEDFGMHWVQYIEHRVALVTRMVETYLALGDPNRAWYWGMRTITMLRQMKRMWYQLHPSVIVEEPGSRYYHPGLENDELETACTAFNDYMQTSPVDHIDDLYRIPNDDCFYGGVRPEQEMFDQMFEWHKTLGLVYLRTAAAGMRLGKYPETRRLLRVARCYQPNSVEIRSMLDPFERPRSAVELQQQSH